MKDRKLTVLAINPGTRYIGIALLRGPILLNWWIKVVKGRVTPAKRQKMTKLLARLIYDYAPDIVAIKELHSSRSSRHLDRLCCNIEAAAAENDIRLVRYSISEIKRFFAPEDNINKGSLPELLFRKHPVLQNELCKERNNINPYHIRMFEAVALGTMAEAKAKRSADYAPALK